MKIIIVNRQKLFKINLSVVRTICNFVVNNEFEIFELTRNISVAKETNVIANAAEKSISHYKTKIISPQRLVAMANQHQLEFYIYIVDEEFMIGLNKRVFGKSKPTDVISYGYLESGTNLAGEIFVSVEEAEKAYKRYRKTFYYEFILYLVHGILHAFGHDDIDVKKRKIMRLREKFYMDLFQLFNPDIA